MHAMFRPGFECGLNVLRDERQGVAVPMSAYSGEWLGRNHHDHRIAGRGINGDDASVRGQHNIECHAKAELVYVERNARILIAHEDSGALQAQIHIILSGKLVSHRGNLHR